MTETVEINITAVRILQNAIEFLRDPAHWAKGMGDLNSAIVRSAQEPFAGVRTCCLIESLTIQPWHPDATCVAVDLIRDEIIRQYDRRSIVGFNDDPATTHEMALAILEDTLAHYAGDTEVFLRPQA